MNRIPMTRKVTILVLDDKHCHPDCPVRGFEDGITGSDEHCCGESLREESLDGKPWPHGRWARLRTEECKRNAVQEGHPCI